MQARAVLAEDHVRRDARLVLAHVGEQRAAVHVADRVEPVAARACESSTSIGLPGSRPTRLEADVVGVRAAADRHEQLVAAHRAARLELDLDLAARRARDRRGLHARAARPRRARAGACSTWSLGERLLARDQAVGRLDQRDLRAEAALGLGHLDADHAAAEDRPAAPAPASRSWPRGSSTASPRAGRRSAGSARSVPVATTTRPARDERVVAGHARGARRRAGRARARASTPRSASQGSWPESSRSWMISSRRVEHRRRRRARRSPPRARPGCAAPRPAARPGAAAPSTACTRRRSTRRPTRCGSTIATLSPASPRRPGAHLAGGPGAEDHDIELSLAHRADATRD